MNEEVTLGSPSTPSEKTEQTTEPCIKEKQAPEEEDSQDTETTTSQQDKQPDWQDRYIRLYAEFENYKKRMAKQQVSWMNIANEGLMMALLPIVEDFERALNSTQKTEDNSQIAREGIHLIHEKLTKTLSQQGLSSMLVKPGDNFDPDYHEALTTRLTNDEKLKGKIVEVVSKGYILGKKVVKVAKVIIGK